MTTSMTAAADTREPSPTTARSRALVAQRTPDAVAIGRAAGDVAPDPAAAVEILRRGLADLADPAYQQGVAGVAPGIGTVLGVRGPLLHAVGRGIRATTRQDRSAVLLDLAERLLREEPLELHWLAFEILERTVGAEPERTWQLVRAEARTAGDWITVDGLARVTARGILAESYRWAELEQLVYSPSRWERRLVGSTVATIPFTDRSAGRTPDIARRGLALVGDLLGDAEPDVQKALAWALRSMARIDQPATIAFLRAAARRAADTSDGHRAWVIRDTFDKLPADVAAELATTLAGVRKRPGAPSTSRAAATAADFLGLGVGVPPSERPILDRH